MTSLTNLFTVLSSERVWSKADMGARKIMTVTEYRSVRICEMEAR